MQPPSTTLLDTKVQRLAHELAMDIREPEDILKDHGVSAAEWEALRADAAFGALLTSKIAEWNGATNTSQRVRIKALALLELNLDRFQEAMEMASPPNLVEVGKFLAGLGGMAPAKGGEGAVQGGAGGAPGFQVRIFIGKDAPPMVIEGSAEPSPSPPQVEG